MGFANATGTNLGKKLFDLGCHGCVGRVGKKEVPSRPVGRFRAGLMDGPIGMSARSPRLRAVQKAGDASSEAAITANQVTEAAEHRAFALVSATALRRGCQHAAGQARKWQ